MKLLIINIFMKLFTYDIGSSGLWAGFVLAYAFKCGPG